MKPKSFLSLLVVLGLGGLAGYLLLNRDHAEPAHDDHGHGHDDHGHGGGHDDHAVEAPRGPHRGRMFTDGGFTLELAIFEDGVPPEFRAWCTLDGKALPPAAVELTVQLTRPGAVVDNHVFAPAGEFSRSPAEVYEPHSFHYAILARHGDRIHRWALAAPEMQTTIAAATVRQAGVVVETAGPALLTETLAVYGQVKLNADRIARATPRFAGLIKETRKSIGDMVEAGEVVAVVEANESLALFEVRAPRDGVIVERTAVAGETVAEGAPLYTTADLSEVWIDLNIPRGDQSRVRAGQPVRMPADGGQEGIGVIARLLPLGSAETQTLTARVVLANADGRWRPGLFVKAEIEVAAAEVPVAVKESALQTLHDFDVVFSQHGEIYQARPLELGRRSRGWVEVLKGLKAGEAYVTENSFLLKADIGKSEASHDH